MSVQFQSNVFLSISFISILQDTKKELDDEFPVYREEFYEFH